MRRVVLLDHLDAGAAVLGNLIDVRAFHQAHADVGVSQALGGARFALSIKFEVRSFEQRVE
jgi:hypothetical protein